MAQKNIHQLPSICLETGEYICLSRLNRPFKSAFLAQTLVELHL